MEFYKPKPDEITVNESGQISANIQPSPLDVLQQDRGLFFVNARLFYKLPIDSNYKKFQEAKQNLISSFDEVLHFYQENESYDEDETKEQLITLLEEEESQRSHYFKYIVSDSSTFKEASREHIKEFLDETGEQDEERHEFVVAYASFLEADCNQLEEVLSDSTRVKILETAHRLSEHAIFIGQITAGVVIGSVVAHHIKKELDK